MSGKYIIYGKDGCSFCNKAQKLLETKNLPYQYLKLNEDYSMEELLSISPSTKTFPQIFYDDRLVGGYIDLEDELD